MAAGKPAQPNPDNECTRNCVQSISAARSGAQRQDSRRVRCPGVGRHLPGGGVLSGKLRDGELTGADVDPSEPPAFAELVESRQIAILTSGEEGRVGNG